MYARVWDRRRALVIAIALMWSSPAAAEVHDVLDRFETREINRCGPFALHACATFLGEAVRPQDLYARLPPNGEMTNFKQLADEATNMGLLCAAVHWTDDVRIPVGAPAILAVRFKGMPHFIAAFAQQGDRVLIVDFPDVAWVHADKLRTELAWRGEALHITNSRLTLVALYVLVLWKQLLAGVIGFVTIAAAVKHLSPRFRGKARQPAAVVIGIVWAGGMGCTVSTLPERPPSDAIRLEPAELVLTFDEAAVDAVGQDRGDFPLSERSEKQVALRLVNQSRETVRIDRVPSRWCA